MKTRVHLLLCCLALAGLGSPSTRGGPLASTCNIGPRPSASLFLPYFEVDLASPDGMSTLLTIGNGAREPQLARVVLWTDWGIPVASFDLLVPGYGNVPVNLRDVLTEVGPPVSGSGLERPASCADPLVQPAVDLDTLVRQLTGAESPVGSDQCWSSDRGEPTVAVGFLTVDTIGDCLAAPRYPTDSGYFSADGSGLATRENTLYGDFLLVEPRQDFAQGAALVHLPADPEIVGLGLEPSFYGSFVPGSLFEDARRPVGSRYLTRFFNGGAFSGGTELLLWIAPFTQLAPLGCGTFTPSVGGGGALSTSWNIRVSGEQGSGTSFNRSLEPLAFATRASFDGLSVEDFAAGTLDVQSILNCSICSPPNGRTPGVVIPLHSAEGRFSVGLEAIALDDPCAPGHH